jgi:protein ImuB
VDRLACVDVAALPLQILLGRHPDWATRPVAVVDHDKPQGVVLWVNERARKAGVLPGHRYTAALALATELRASEVLRAEVDDCVAKLVERLRRFTPEVEPCADEPGVFWLNAGGLNRLYESLQTWGESIRVDLHSSGFRSSVAVGFSRFGVYATAKARPRSGIVVFARLDDEQREMRRVPLRRIGLDPEARDALDKLAVRTVGDFLALPAGGIARRLGAQTHRLHRLASGELWAPLQPRPVEESLARQLDLDDPEVNRESLTFLIKQEIDPLLKQLAARGEALTELRLTLTIERHGAHEERVRPAEPTLDPKQLLDLVRLRLESIALPAGVMRISLTPTGTPATAEQLRLFEKKPRRDPRAAACAIARVRAALGDQSVVRARLADGHLPEAQFTWEPIDRLSPARPRTVALRPLVRRIEMKPVPLASRSTREPDGWLLGGLQHGPVEQLSGPYVLSGGWWQGEVERDYYFALLRSGALEWVYYDRKRCRWFRQGRVA